VTITDVNVDWVGVPGTNDGAGLGTSLLKSARDVYSSEVKSRIQRRLRDVLRPSMTEILVPASLMRFGMTRAAETVELGFRRRIGDY
jgi:hypothetical protein